jgi:hypothetical protein
LRRACRLAGVKKTSFWRWKDTDNERKERYARARQEQIECWADDTLDIADDNVRDVYETEDGREIVNTDVIARARLRVDTRKWLLSKLCRDPYGDTTEHKHSGNINILLANYAPTLEGESEEVKVIGDGAG